MGSFQRATKKASKLRLALIGPAGSGKTWTALSVALALEGPVALVDTEKGSASKYADSFAFDVLELDTFHPQKYIEAIAAAAQAGYKTLVIDSLSHAWTGKGGALELHDAAVDRQRGSKNAFAAWREVTPHHNALVEAIVQAPLHIIATMRAKTEYVQEKDERTGKTAVRKIGLAPVQRDGLEYEFDVVGDLDQDHNFVIGKTRCPALNGKVLRCPGADLAADLKAWLGGVVSPTPASPPQPVAKIDRGQTQVILDLIKQAGTDSAKFCAAYGIGSPSDLPAEKYADAESKLRRRLNETAKTSPAGAGTPTGAEPPPARKGKKAPLEPEWETTEQIEAAKRAREDLEMGTVEFDGLREQFAGSPAQLQSQQGRLTKKQAEEMAAHLAGLLAQAGIVGEEGEVVRQGA